MRRYLYAMQLPRQYKYVIVRIAATGWTSRGPLVSCLQKRLLVLSWQSATVASKLGKQLQLIKFVIAKNCYCHLQVRPHFRAGRDPGQNSEQTRSERICPSTRPSSDGFADVKRDLLRLLVDASIPLRSTVEASAPRRRTACQT